MSKYYLEDELNFFDELKKLVNDDTNKENKIVDEIYDNVCCITNLPLEKYFVKLECGHLFNYVPLYKEIFNQKLVYKNYNIYKETHANNINIKHCDNYIKCPYCRNIQTKLLLYHSELGVEKIYGINSTNIAYLYKNDDKYFCNKVIGLNMEIKDFICCKNANYYCFQYKKIYCYHHYKVALKTIKLNSIQLKKDITEMKKRIKQKFSKLKKEKKKMTVKIEELGCKEILKTGLNKGKQCSCKVYKDNFCKRHLKVLQEA